MARGGRPGVGVPRRSPSWGPASRPHPFPDPPPHRGLRAPTPASAPGLRLSPLAPSQCGLARAGQEASSFPMGAPLRAPSAALPAWLPGCPVDPDTTHPAGVDSSPQALWGESPPKPPTGLDRPLMWGPASALLPCVDRRQRGQTFPFPTSQCGESPIDPQTPNPGFLQLQEARPAGHRTGSRTVLLGPLCLRFGFLKPTAWVCAEQSRKRSA